jgi:hypothetical protein
MSRRERCGSPVALARGSGEPRLAVATLLADEPKWLARGHGRLEAVLATYALEHNQVDLAVRALTLAAERTDAAAGRFYALAALYTAELMDLPRARELLSAAGAAGGSALLIAAIDWHVRKQAEHDPALAQPELLRTATPAELASEPMCLVILGEDAGHRGDVPATLAYAEDAAAADPSSGSARLRVAEMLLWRMAQGGSVVPEEDLRRIETLATEVMEQRRRWAGPSHQALTVLVSKHLITGAYQTMVTLATPRPDGHAEPREALDSHVIYLGALAAVALGDRDTAQTFAERAADKPVAVGLRALTASPGTPREEEISLWRDAVAVVDLHEMRVRAVRVARVRGSHQSVGRRRLGDKARSDRGGCRLRTALVGLNPHPNRDHQS